MGSFAPGERSDSIIWFISLLLEVFTWRSRCFCSFKAGSYFGVDSTSWPVCAGICHTCADPEYNRRYKKWIKSSSFIFLTIYLPLTFSLTLSTFSDTVSVLLLLRLGCQFCLLSLEKQSTF